MRFRHAGWIAGILLLVAVLGGAVLLSLPPPNPAAAPPRPASEPAREPEAPAAPPPAPVAPAPATPPSPAVEEYVLPDRLPLDVRVVDADTGESIGGASVALRRASGEPLPLEPYPAGFGLASSPFRPGEHVSIDLAVVPPPGYVPEEPGTFRASGTISRLAGRLEVTVLLFREAGLVVEVVDAGGNPAAGAEVLRVRAAGRGCPVTAGAVPPGGRLAIPGLPALRGETVVVTAAGGDREGESMPVLLVSPGGPPTARVVLDRFRSPPASSLRSMRTSVSTSISVVHLMEPGTSTLRVLLRRRDGSAAARARVRVRGEPPAAGWFRETAADDTGVAVFPGLPAGPVSIAVPEPGFAGPAVSTAELAEGATSEVAVDEAPGLPLSLRVLDAEGLPVPGATVTLGPRGSVPYAHLVGDRQVLNLFTDLDGRLLLDDVPEGEVEISARYGSRSAKGTPGPDRSLTLRLPPP